MLTQVCRNFHSNDYNLFTLDFNKFWDGHEYFLDRHRNSFEVIANWLTNGGELVCPDTVPIDIFLYEISFYRLPVPVIEDFLRNEGLLMEKEDEVKDLVSLF